MPSFTCALCQESRLATRENRVLLPKGDDACAECFRESIVPQFWHSIQHPSEFPFHWGSSPLRFQNYAQYIPAYTEMLKAFFLRRGELETEPGKRVYCLGEGCEEFLGAQRDHRKYELDDVYVCDACFCHVCAWCKKGAEPGHVCTTASAQKDEEIPGLEKGKDYQLCPGCTAPCSLEDGCNSMRCSQCRTEFCVICNEKVTHGDNEHWQPGKPCPRFGKPGDPRALYDDQVRILDDAPAAARAAPEDELLRWRRRFHEKMEDARRRLREMEDFLEDEIGRTRPFTRLRHSFNRALHFVRILSENYGVFDIDERDPGRFFPALPRPAEHRWQQYDNHQEILRFMNAQVGNGLDAEVVNHAWLTLPRLFDLASWYVNHILIEKKEEDLAGGRFRVNFTVNYGHPELDRPFGERAGGRFRGRGLMARAL